jgi:ribosome modulation factor
MKSQSQLHDELERSGWFRPFAEYDEPAPAEKPPVVKRTKQPKQLTPWARFRHHAFQDGKRAKLNGESRSENPYQEGTLNNELWDQGWSGWKPNP